MEFKREIRYLVFKVKDVPATALKDMVAAGAMIDGLRKLRGALPFESLVIESDWPEYEPAWEEIQRRMEGRPTIMDEELVRWQDKIYALLNKLAPDANIDGGGCDSGDPLDLTLAEIAQGFNYWDNLLFETMESISHSKIEGSTFKAAADLIIKLASENEELAQNVCDECSSENYGWVFNRVEGRGACTCMLEAEPFQILLKALERIAAGKCETGSPLSEARAALRAVLPLDYAE